MIDNHQVRETQSLQRFLRGLWRRKWLVLVCLLGVPLVTVLLTMRQEPLYEATSEVLLDHRNPVAGVTDAQGSAISEDAERASLTQARLARVTDVAERTLTQLGLTDRSPREFLETSSVTGGGTTNLLEFSVVDSDPGLAVALSTEYARQYTIYRQERDTAATRIVLENVLRSLDSLPDQDSARLVALRERQQELETILSLQGSSSSLVEEAQEARQVQPLPVRNAIIAVVLGLGLGALIALLLNSLDTRVHTVDEIASRLGLPLLARVPEPPRRLRASRKLVMVEEPGGSAAEAFRVLRTSFEFATINRNARVVVVSSAVEGEGKTSTVANLAIACALAGRRVVLVDLDLRRPSIDRYFGLPERRGLTDVVLASADLEDVIFPIPLPDGARGTGRVERESGSPGLLEVLPCGPVPPNAGELAGSRTLAEILELLRSRADLVLIDSSPLLRAGDTLALTPQVDALVVITRLGVVRRPMLSELARVLQATPVAKLGFVATGADDDNGVRGGYVRSRGYEAAPKQRI